ncbi:hypothetical protein GCM10010253_65480 [Streptomyces badius]|uniref:YCII-related domain-containing protein n=1 Tax=Streptomyces badius TaxID=1941 RepID=A0ABQ2TR08_STRBA|nr:hypothetical protein GCM10010253_65480 [Streptomyces badius]
MESLVDVQARDSCLMYLVHLTLAPPGVSPLPAETGRVLAARAPDVLEHVSVHPRARPHPVVGLFLRVASLEEAETTAERIWERAAAACPQLAGWHLRRAEVPLIAAAVEWFGPRSDFGPD